MATQQATVGRLGRGRRPTQTTPQKLKEEVYSAAREKRKAEQKLRTALRQAKIAGVEVDIGEALPNPDFKLRRQHLHIFPAGLGDPDHGHLVIELSSELSPSCIAELQAKVTNGKVTLDRDVFEDGRWRVAYYEDELSFMAAD